MPIKRRIKSVFLCCLFFLGIFISPAVLFPFSKGKLFNSPAHSEETPPQTKASGPVIVATFEGVINPVAAEYFGEVISKAESAGAEALVIQMDTPGGLDTSMRMIIKDMSASSVPVVVYVSPKGGRAASAGVFITMAAHVAAMAPKTNMGAAHPVAMGGGEMDKEMKKKVENDAAAYIRSIAEERGRNAEWAEEAVRQSVSVTETEALEKNIIDLVSEDLESLLSALDGRVVEISSGPRTLHTVSVPVREIPMSGRLKILNALSNPNIAYILMLLGIYGLIFELSNPGAILPGVVGAICLILAFYSFQTLPINYAGVLLILLAVILFIIETQVPSFGLLTAGGVVAMILGSLMLIRTDVPSMRISLSVILPTVAVTAAFFVFVVGLAWKVHRKRPVSGLEEMVGMQGLVQTEINPRGRVIIHGELWEAEGSEPFRKGDSVQVTSVEGLTLHVKRVKT